tara:strand:+ start:174 stop:518 length:345 start_codon:yes stop_codon:yes gene_type:complete
MEITIYHNPRCRKSREALSFLKEKSYRVKVVEYLKDLMSIEDLMALLNDLDIRPIELVRKHESIWKEQFKERNLNDTAILEAMVQNPILIERPIVKSKKGAVVARPLERVLEVI